MFGCPRGLCCWRLTPCHLSTGTVGIPSLRKAARGDTWWPRRKAKTCQKGCPMGASTSVVQSSSTQPLLWPHTRRLRWQAAPWASTRHRRPPLHNRSSGCPTHFGMFHVVAMGSICALQQLKIDRRRRRSPMSTHPGAAVACVRLRASRVLFLL